ncbi:uncharacterized protein LOC131221505 isoform X1 [Magnolia sinica]|uniref:uncharacterized protein LOC131221505 isoform X1 n=1 Tax=Magnolia sinica TaxID=86752 RepID=UPI002659DAE8|nr:uncharacterized protein LOC131221505 isoform X1 [Magnolia sinica]
MPETFSMSESSKAEAWVNHMIGSTTDESVEVEFEGCPSRTGMVWQCNWREDSPLCLVLWSDYRFSSCIKIFIVMKCHIIIASYRYAFYCIPFKFTASQKL